MISKVVGKLENIKDGLVKIFLPDINRKAKALGIDVIPNEVSIKPVKVGKKDLQFLAITGPNLSAPVFRLPLLLRAADSPHRGADRGLQPCELFRSSRCGGRDPKRGHSFHGQKRAVQKSCFRLADQFLPRSADQQERDGLEGNRAG